MQAFFHRVALLLALAPLAACASHLSKGVYTSGDARYRIGEVPRSWRLVRLHDNDVAFLSTDSPHSLAINATCHDHGDPSLPVLTRHLLMGFTDPRTVAETEETLDGREALRTRVIARMDGVPIEMLLVVMKKDGCVYDFTYLSPIGRLEERETTFEEILHHFKTEPHT